MPARCTVAFVFLLPMTLNAASEVTFSHDIAPLLFEKCAPCHHVGESAPFSLLSYADARKHGKQIALVTGQRYMPPWLPEPGHGDFVDSSRLSEAQIALIARWVREGMVQGDPVRQPAPPRFSEGWQLGTPDIVLRLDRPFQLPAEGPDVFRNFVLPVDSKETRYVRAFELRPGDKRVVHHANIIVDRSRTLRRRDGEDGRPGFAGMDVETEVTGEFDPDSHFLFWKPGTPAQQEPADMAWKLEPGSDLILNLHLRPSGKPESVNAMLGLYFTEKPPARRPMLVQLEHDGAIEIPAGSNTFAVTDQLRLPQAVSLLAVYPHAHYLGKQMEAWAQFPSGERVSLLKIEHWDISWQAVFTYRQPVALPEGTVLSMRILYDNTATNPRNPSSPPVRVHTGNGSQDEMGHVWFQVLPRDAWKQGSEADPRLGLQEALMRRRIEKYPGDFVAHFNLGAALQVQGRPEEALPYLRQAAKINPSSAMARNNVASALFAAEHFEEATTNFQQALLLDPEYQNARYNLARTLAATGDTAGAISEVQTYLAANLGDADAEELAGRLLSKAGRFTEALPHLRRAAELAPHDAGLLINLAVGTALAGDTSAAIPLFEKALELDPTSVAAKQNLERARRSLSNKKPN